MSDHDEALAMTMYAWVGKDEFDDTIGIKAGITPLGLIPLVAVEQSNINKPAITNQLQGIADHLGKPMLLVRCKVEAVVGEIAPRRH